MRLAKVESARDNQANFMQGGEKDLLNITKIVPP